MPERVVVVGNGGREDALSWKLSETADVFSLPRNVTAESLSAFYKENEIDLVVVGPEDPLAAGIVDQAQERDLKAFGPRKDASRIEWDKEYADNFADRHNIPHPKSQSFTSYEEALEYVQNQNPKDIVIKANGLTLGKGVLLPESKEEAEAALARIFKCKEFGTHDTVVVQERLRGREVSLICLTDGTTIIPLLPAQDHKRIFDNDQGPNTGGMGAFAPAELPDQEKIYEEIVKPTIDGLNQDGILYQGALYIQLMLTSEGPKVIEYNSRFDDPETQAQVMLFDGDFYRALKACADGTLTPDIVSFRDGFAVCVVLATAGYPATTRTGDEIYGLEKIEDPDVYFFHAATKVEDGKTFTNGGRVLGVTAVGPTLEEARQKAYSQIGPEGVHFDGMQYRTDIGKK
ncbi:MAG: phosphoribosylamine--glycine ligase [Candidatus Curtissbacteria bacterium]|nr:phosphoribosylamine--glycine ligase [Candidatus Curtissbacteria bacterium]